MKMVDIKDIGVKYVVLSGGKYLIGDRVIKIDGWREQKVQIQEGDEVKKINESEVIVKYVKGEEEMTVEEYKNIESEILKHRHWNEHDEAEWDSLEDEFEYRKLTTYWKPIYKTIQTFSEPLKVAEVSEINYNTGNKYIQNLFFNGDPKSEISLYIYDRPSAREDIVAKVFKELGFEYEDNISYMRSEGRKVWGNSSHSVIRYVTAFGKYIFDDKWGDKHTPRGTLEDLKKMYEDDCNKIKDIIMTNYNRVYGKINQDEFDFVGLVDKLQSLRYTVSDIDSKVKTQGFKHKAICKIDKMIEEINGMFK